MFHDKNWSCMINALQSLKTSGKPVIVSAFVFSQYFSYYSDNLEICGCVCKRAGRSRRLTSERTSIMSWRVARPLVPFTANTFSAENSAPSVTVDFSASVVGATRNHKTVFRRPMRITFVESITADVEFVTFDSHCTAKCTVPPYNSS